MRIILNINKSLEENAEAYFERAKKAKKKAETIKHVLARFEKELQELEKNKEKEMQQMLLEEEKKKQKSLQEKKWYEKFHWFYSSEGFLCIGGRDATSNDIVIKKHTEKNDVVFHTDAPGSPFFVVKTEGKKVGEQTVNEVAQATASYSKAWKSGVSAIEVFYVGPEQITKEAKPGEFMARGSFMVYGKRNYVRAELKLAVGIKDNQVIGGPVDAVSKQAEKYVLVIQGDERTSDVAKKIQWKISGDIDDIIKFLPAGGCSLQKLNK